MLNVHIQEGPISLKLNFIAVMDMVLVQAVVLVGITRGGNLWG